MAATPWATIANVKTFTGKTVDADTLAQAVATLELHVGLIQDVERSDITGRDRHFLKLATCYQAAWVAAQPDLYERNDVDSASQDGESASFRPDAHTLAPLARRAIKRLSWRGSRTVSAPTTTRVRNINSDEYEDTLPWQAV